MVENIINKTINFLRESGVDIFIRMEGATYGRRDGRTPIYTTSNKNLTLEVRSDSLNIDEVFPVITFLNAIISEKSQKIHTDFNDKTTQFLASLSPFKDKKDSFKKVSKSIRKVLKLKRVILLETVKDRLIGIGSEGEDIYKSIESGSVEELVLKKNNGAYVSKGVNVKSMFYKENYLYVEPLNGVEKRIGLIIFESDNPIPIENINMLRQFSSLAGLFIEINIFREDMTRLMENSLNVMIDALDSRTKGGKNHTKRVVEISLNFAKYLNLDNNLIKTLERGALLHDIGKIGVSDTILNKDGPLNDNEIEQVRQHPIYGMEIITKIKGIEKGVHDIVMYHHERWDGKGYPKGLKGKEIPFLARILIFSDIYEALTSDRSFRKAYDKEFAINYIKKNSGAIFDPELTDKFLEYIGGTSH